MHDIRFQATMSQKKLLSYAPRYHDPTFEETVSAVQGHVGLYTQQT